MAAQTTSSSSKKSSGKINTDNWDYDRNCGWVASCVIV